MQPFRTILFAADFSQNSLDAFRAACSLAIGDETRLVVLHVAEPHWVPAEPVYYGQQASLFYAYGQQAPLFYAAPSDPSRHETLRRRLRKFYAPDRPIDVHYRTREGAPSAEILLLATELGSDLIVLGTHGRTGLRRMLAGSVAVSVLRGARCPVLAVRSAEQPRAAKTIKVILHPTDFSVHSEAALGVARWVARDHGARLIILHVAPLEVLLDGTTAAEVDPRSDRDALYALKKRVDGPDLEQPVETILKRGYPAPGIIETAEEVGCDLIVMGTQGRTGLSRLLMGSVAEYVLPKAICPVLVSKHAERAAAPTSDRHAEETITV